MDESQIDRVTAEARELIKEALENQRNNGYKRNPNPVQEAIEMLDQDQDVGEWFWTNGFDETSAVIVLADILRNWER